MKKRILKIVLATTLSLCLIFCLASCGGAPSSLPDAKDAKGEIDGTDIDWSYDADDKTLTIEGNGEIPDCASASDVWWSEVRHSVEELELSDGITSIGDYAFYYFPELDEAELHEGISSLGNFSFAFCSKMEKISLPSTLTSIGDSCFETCTALTGIYVPSSVTEIGERAFAHCSKMKDATIMAQITELRSLTFMNCPSLSTLCFFESSRGISVADDAFEGAKLGFDDAEFTASNEGKATITVKYVYEDGSEAAPLYTEQKDLNSSYSIPSPAIEGYVADRLTVSGTATTFNVEETVKYSVEQTETEAEETEAAVDTEAEKNEDKEEGISVGTIIALVILVVVIAAIVVLAVLMMRSDKKSAASNGKQNGKKK